MHRLGGCIIDAMPHGPVQKTRRGTVARSGATEPSRRRHGGHLLPLLAAGIQAHDVAQHASIHRWVDIDVYKKNDHYRDI